MQVRTTFYSNRLGREEVVITGHRAGVELSLETAKAEIVKYINRTHPEDDRTVDGVDTLKIEQLGKDEELSTEELERLGLIRSRSDYRQRW